MQLAPQTTFLASASAYSPAMNPQVAVSPFAAGAALTPLSLNFNLTNSMGVAAIASAGRSLERCAAAVYASSQTPAVQTIAPSTENAQVTQAQAPAASARAERVVQRVPSHDVQTNKVEVEAKVEVEQKPKSQSQSQSQSESQSKSQSTSQSSIEPNRAFDLPIQFDDIASAESLWAFAGDAEATPVDFSWADVPASPFGELASGGMRFPGMAPWWRAVLGVIANEAMDAELLVVEDAQALSPDISNPIQPGAKGNTLSIATGLVDPGASQSTERFADYAIAAFSPSQPAAHRLNLEGLRTDVVLESAAFVVNSTEVNEGESFVVEHVVGGVMFRRHFVQHEGRPVFAGWEEAKASAFAVNAIPEIQGRAPEGFRHDGLVVMGLGQSGGESAFGREPLAIDDPEVVERLADLLMAQLAAGPKSLAKGEMLAQFNAFVRARLSNGSSAPHTQEEWEAYLREAIALGVRYALPFDERGARALDEMQNDSSRILGIDAKAYIEWEGHFGEEFVSAQIFSPEGGILADRESPKGRLLAAFEGHMGQVAEKKIGRSASILNIGLSDETDLQWSIARASLIPGLAEKIDYASRLIAELRMQDRRSMASQALALVFRASNASEYAPRRDAFLPRWSKQEIVSVIAGLMNDDTWDVVNHRAFRMHLTPAENEYVNRIVERANFQNAVSTLRGIDLSTASDDEFWNALEGSGQAEMILDNVVNKMAYMLNPAIVENSFSDELN